MSREMEKARPDYHHKTRQGLDAWIHTPRTIVMKEIHKNLYLAENSNYDHQKVDRHLFLKGLWSQDPSMLNFAFTDIDGLKGRKHQATDVRNNTHFEQLQTSGTMPIFGRNMASWESVGLQRRDAEKPARAYLFKMGIDIYVRNNAHFEQVHLPGFFATFLAEASHSPMMLCFTHFEQIFCFTHFEQISCFTHFEQFSTRLATSVIFLTKSITVTPNENHDLPFLLEIPLSPIHTLCA
ncbi:hypothetical protein DFJ58DRAFT_847758 [Suillus subalutaceus]|uniref:uncharacterized protein n=1 Tax=Suillus subalutaceus TaxID=48586 RepID=UPI001B85F529|nr:uncharacterized protein DFJ58DRAFT_847758 [Suillus subalutaceus]KAG1833674.1 hypothetical protein DFJ58DRAFT_847758 [Suillus subalutaceus]